MKSKSWLIALSVLWLLVGCSTSSYSPPATIPNLHWVEAGVWRSGQPKLPSDWVYLRDWLGITRVVKLNEQDEAPDVLPPGMTLYCYPIDTAHQIDPVFHPLDPVVMSNIVWVIRQGHVLVHCQHGEDRTGLAIALYRLTEGWSWQAADTELRTNNFHRALRGLDSYWDKQRKRR